MSYRFFLVTPPSVPGVERSGPAHYSFTLIADTDAASPYSHLVVRQAINDAGDVAFIANLRAGGQTLLKVDADGSLSTVSTAGGHWHFQRPDPAADRILAIGDLVFGPFVAAFPPHHLNPPGWIAMAISYSGSTWPTAGG